MAIVQHSGQACAPHVDFLTWGIASSPNMAGILLGKG